MVLLLLGIVFFLLATKTITGLSDTQFLLYISLHNEGYSVNRAKEIVDKFLNEERYGISLWSSGENVYCKNTVLGRHAYVEVIRYCGIPKTLYTATDGIYGNDTKRCMIDEKTAMDLFGETDIVGETVSLENKQFIIDYVISGKQGVLICEATDNDLVNMLTIQLDNQKSRIEIIRKLKVNYGITGNTIQLQRLFEVASGMLLFIPTSCLAYMLYYISIYTKENKSCTARERIIYSTFILGAIAIFSIVIINNSAFTLDFAVNKISNFEAWRTSFEEFKKAAIYLIKLEKGSPLLKYWCIFYKTMTLASVSLLSFWISFFNLKSL